MAGEQGKEGRILEKGMIREETEAGKHITNWNDYILKIIKR